MYLVAHALHSQPLSVVRWLWWWVPSWGGGQLARLVRVGRRECRKNGFSAGSGVFFSGFGGAATPLVLVLGQGRANAGSHAVFGLLSPRGHPFVLSAPRGCRAFALFGFGLLGAFCFGAPTPP